MNGGTSDPGWLERNDGTRVPIPNTCSIGRSPSNQVVLPDDRVSRRHAVIHLQGVREFWLVDLGSSNGTFVNHRRVTQPIRLRDGDQIQVSQFCLTFHQSQGSEATRLDRSASDKTIVEIRAVNCWLLVTDIEGSTRLAKQLPAEQLPVLIGGWFAVCKTVVEANGGSINKYLGDGLFAYWREAGGAEASVARALQALKELQTREQPRFRLVLHFGSVLAGGVASLSEESLSGPEVNFVFRMERLAGALGAPRLVSEPAWARLKSQFVLTEVGPHTVPGFEGRFGFFGF
jgi:class 3 adenylate cyclase